MWRVSGIVLLFLPPSRGIGTKMAWVLGMKRGEALQLLNKEKKNGRNKLKATIYIEIDTQPQTHLNRHGQTHTHTHTLTRNCNKARWHRLVEQGLR